MVNLKSSICIAIAFFCSSIYEVVQSDFRMSRVIIKQTSVIIISYRTLVSLWKLYSTRVYFYKSQEIERLCRSLHFLRLFFSRIFAQEMGQIFPRV